MSYKVPRQPAWNSTTSITPTFGQSVHVAAAPATITLPALVSVTTDGQMVQVKLDSAGNGTVTVNPTGADTIDGAATFTFANPNGRGCVQFTAFGTNWSVC